MHFIIALSLLPLSSLAAPIFGINLDTIKDSITGTAKALAVTPVASKDFDSTFLRPAQFSRLAYCSSAAVKGGKTPQAVPGITVLQSGGDGGKIPLYFIAHDPSTKSIVVAHQGTDSKNILSILNDAEFGLTPLNQTYFKGAPSGVEVHSGFQDTFERTATGILSGVQSALKSTKESNVLVVGHSLGAAIASMDAVMLKMNLPSNIAVTSTVFGLPRGGNQEWADLIDKTLGKSFNFATNQNDPVPQVPPQFLGFRHSAGETHLTAVTNITVTAVACPGQENPGCIEGDNILDASVTNHKGPYLHNISMSHGSCPF